MARSRTQRRVAERRLRIGCLRSACIVQHDEFAGLVKAQIAWLHGLFSAWVRFEESDPSGVK